MIDFSYCCIFTMVFTICKYSMPRRKRLNWIYEKNTESKALIRMKRINTYAWVPLEIIVQWMTMNSKGFFSLSSSHRHYFLKEYFSDLLRNWRKKKFHKKTFHSEKKHEWVSIKRWVENSHKIKYQTASPFFSHTRYETKMYLCTEFRLKSLILPIEPYG